MTFFVFLVALGSFAAGAALVRFLLVRRVGEATPATPDISMAPESNIPLCATIDDLAGSVADAFAREARVECLGIYAGSGGDDMLDELWRATGARELPARIPASIVDQLPGAYLLTLDELASGRVPEMPPAASEGTFSENPFDLDDASLTGAPGGAVEAVEPLSEVVAVPWRGPFGIGGLFVARRMPAGSDLARAERVAARAGERVAACRAIEDRTRRAEAAERELALRSTEPPAPRAVETRRGRAAARMIEALQAPRREGDLVGNTVQLLAEGLGSDRCYAVEVHGFRMQPVAHERRSEAAASAVGIDLGEPFLGAVRSKAGATIKAITLDAAQAAEHVSEEARARLGPVSRMMVPVLEKGRVALVYVAEWIDLAKKWNDEDVAFAERVVARSAVARERILQLEALAEQAAHATAAREEVEQALDQLQSIVAALPDAIVGLDAEGRITFVNRAATQLFNKVELGLMGRWMAELAAEQGYDAGTWERALAAETTQSYTAALTSAGHMVDITVVPNLSSSVCSRIISLSGQRSAGSY